MSTSSTYAVAARSTADVVAAVKFARQNNLRLVVKEGLDKEQTDNALCPFFDWVSKSPRDFTIAAAPTILDDTDRYTVDYRLLGVRPVFGGQVTASRQAYLDILRSLAYSCDSVR